ncbi:MAG: hypothetical protein WBE26_10790 [Phycisphaerae bacterium]
MPDPAEALHHAGVLGQYLREVHLQPCRAGRILNMSDGRMTDEAVCER